MKKGKFSEEQQRIIAKEYKEERLSIKEVAIRYNTTITTITRVLNNQKVERNNVKRKITKKEKEKAIALREKGVSIAKISKQLGVSKGRLDYWLSNQNITVKKPEKEKKKINILLGSELKYKPSKRILRNDKEVKNIKVIQMGTDRIVCKHEEGFLETFTKVDLMLLFQEGKMQLVGR